MSDAAIQQLIEQLSNKASAKRRSAAKKLRKLKAKEAGPALLTTLKNELNDKRTWETQYQMIMALGESGYTEGLDFLLELAKQEFEAAMIYMALGDAIIKLTNFISLSKTTTILTAWIEDDQIKLLNGGLRALATLHLVPGDTLIQKIIQYASLPNNEELQFWTAAASPGWPSELTNNFLNKIRDSASLEDTIKAANAALKGRFLNWNPL